MLRRSPRHLLRTLSAALALAAAAFASGCADSDACATTVDVEVQPRVALTGGIELSDRSAGRVVIDEVVAHAPLALLESASGTFDVVDGDAPLLFRYLLSDRSGFGAAVGGVRIWSLPRHGADLSVAFAPAPEALRIDGVDSDVVDDLAGHTLVVHGTIAVSSSEGGVAPAVGFGDVDPDGGAADGTDSDVDPDGGAADGTDSDVDPDGGAADGTGDDTSDGGAADGTSDVDPDGGAAQPQPSDVDPDGGAAQPTRDDVDPDGGAAGQKPGGKPSDVDPDGGAAQGDIDSAAAREQGLPKSAPRRDFRRGIVMVPFTVVVDGSFALSVDVAAADLATVGAGEVLPIDLELSASQLLDADRLSLLEAVAADAVADDVEAPSVRLELANAATATSVSVKSGVRKPTRVSSETSRVKVTSGGTRR